MSKQFLGAVIVVFLVLFGLFAFAKKDKGDNGSGVTGQVTNHIRGKGTSGVTLTEYGDLQCPACGSYYPMVKQLEKAYGDKLAVQFRHYPLNQIHPHAYQASRAAEAAGKQGKFFEMHDMMYENQDSWSSLNDVTSVFVGYAQQLGLNVDQFKKDMDSSAVAASINADIKAGQKAGVTATPTFLINGEVIKNPTTVDGFKTLIDEAIKQKSN